MKIKGRIQVSIADEIRRKQRMKHLLAEIVENLKDYFDELQIRRFGQKSRFVVLNDIKSIHKVGSKGLTLVKASFNSELGELDLAIAIKKFPSIDEALSNKVQTSRLADKLRNTGVLTPRVVFEYGNTLIYEGIQGDSFFDSPINNRYKLIMAGEALSKYHSAELRLVESQRYVHIANTIFKELKLSDEQLKKFIDRGGELMQKILIYYSGTTAFGDFHPGNILFSTNNTINEQKNIQMWLIDPEYTEDIKSADRMEDIGTFFLRSAIDHYAKYGNLKLFRDELQPFFEGYDRFLYQYGMSLYQIYNGQHEVALSFHLGLNVLLEALFIQKKADITNEAIFMRWTTCIVLANHLWSVGVT